MPHVLLGSYFRRCLVSWLFSRIGSNTTLNMETCRCVIRILCPYSMCNKSRFNFLSIVWKSRCREWNDKTVFFSVRFFQINLIRRMANRVPTIGTSRKLRFIDVNWNVPVIAWNSFRNWKIWIANTRMQHADFARLHSALMRSDLSTFLTKRQTVNALKLRLSFFLKHREISIDGIIGVFPWNSAQSFPADFDSVIIGYVKN